LGLLFFGEHSLNDLYRGEWQVDITSFSWVWTTRLLGGCVVRTDLVVEFIRSPGVRQLVAIKQVVIVFTSLCIQSQNDRMADFWGIAFKPSSRTRALFFLGFWVTLGE
jgi:hypothetical protein